MPLETKMKKQKKYIKLIWFLTIVVLICSNILALVGYYNGAIVVNNMESIVNIGEEKIEGNISIILKNTNNNEEKINLTIINSRKDRAMYFEEGSFDKEIIFNSSQEIKILIKFNFNSTNVDRYLFYPELLFDGLPNSNWVKNEKITLNLDNSLVLIDETYHNLDVLDEYSIYTWQYNDRYPEQHNFIYAPNYQINVQKVIDKQELSNLGEEVKVSITVKNEGERPITNLRVIEYLSSDLEVTSPNNFEEVDDEIQVLRKDIEKLDPGKKFIFSYSALFWFNGL